MMNFQQDGFGAQNETQIHADMYNIVCKVLQNHNWNLSQVSFTKAVKNTKTENVRIKRPMNAFMVWAQAARKQLASRFPQMHNSELSKNLGRLWREFSDFEKKPFIDEAERLRHMHKIQFPNYKYQPGRRKKRTTIHSVPNVSQSVPTSTITSNAIQRLEAIAKTEIVDTKPVNVKMAGPRSGTNLEQQHHQEQDHDQVVQQLNFPYQHSAPISQPMLGQQEPRIYLDTGNHEGLIGSYIEPYSYEEYASGAAPLMLNSYENFHLPSLTSFTSVSTSTDPSMWPSSTTNF